MTGIVTSPVVPALDNPEPSETKLGRAWGAGIDWSEVAETISEPSHSEAAPLDKRALEAQIGPDMAYAPQWITGSFRVPYGMREAQFEAYAREMATRWFEAMKSKGYDIASGAELLVRPGPNPSKDMATGLEIPGYRDYLLTTQFVERHPQTFRLELPGELFDPYRPRQRATSGDEED